MDIWSCYVTTPDIPDVDRLYLSGMPSSAPMGSIDPQGKYRLADVGPGAMSWRRQFITSPYSHGGVPVSQTKDNINARLAVLVTGFSMANLQSNISLLLRALEQYTYEIHVSFGDRGGVQRGIWQWRCYAADYQAAEDGSFNGSMFRSLAQLYTFNIPRDPIPIYGGQ